MTFSEAVKILILCGSFIGFGFIIAMLILSFMLGDKFNKEKDDNE